MDIPAMFCGAVAEFDARVRQIGDHQWQAATPDEDWSVRDLVNHVAGEDLWAPPLLAGSTIAEVGVRFDGDVLAADPKAAWTLGSSRPARPGSGRWRTLTAARARSRRGRRCPVMRTPRPCCWPVSAGP